MGLLDRLFRRRGSEGGSGRTDDSSTIWPVTAASSGQEDDRGDGDDQNGNGDNGGNGGGDGGGGNGGGGNGGGGGE